MASSLPHRIAVLCYLFDDAGRVLLLRRNKSPNQGLFSPVGGKLKTDVGESPTACAIREIHEETGVRVGSSELHLTGVVSEAGYGDLCHWLMFLYEVVHPVVVTRTTCREGSLGWHDPATVGELDIPQTDRQVLWPLFGRYRGRFFTAHIDCGGGNLSWRLEQPAAEQGLESGSEFRL